MLDVSIIIISYNTKEITQRCLDSLFHNTTGIDFEVIVVDNDSHDGSKEMLESYEGIRYVQSGANLGFGKANNLGYTYSTGRYILFLNSDTYLLNNAVKYFVDEFDNLPDNVGCIGAKLMKPDLTPNHSFQLFPSLYSTFRVVVELLLKCIGVSLRSNFDERRFDTCERFEVDYITGADLCIRKEAIEQCGLFDPEFFMYFEETEMQFRYSQNGFKRMIISSPGIVHIENASTKSKGKKFSFFNRYTYFSSYIRYMRKRYSLPKYILFRLCFIGFSPLFFARYYSPKEKIRMFLLLFTPLKYLK